MILKGIPIKLLISLTNSQKVNCFFLPSRDLRPLADSDRHEVAHFSNHKFSRFEIFSKNF